MINWKDRQQVYLRLKDGDVKSINARRIVIDGFEEFVFFVHTSCDPNHCDYVLSEGTTGSEVGRGLKWYDAARDAEIKLAALGKEKFVEHINHLLKKFGSVLNQAQ
jgi:hypothetical protein